MNDLVFNDEDYYLPARHARGEVAFRNKLQLRGGGCEVQNRIVGVAGRKGSGKSTLTRHILSRCYRLFVFDTMGEHHEIPDQFTDQAEAHMYIWDAGHSDQEFQGSYIPEDGDDDGLDRDFGLISTAVYQTGNMTLAVEELPMLSEPNYVPPSFNRIVRLGRHRSINILYTGQRLSECPRRVTAATDVFVLFSHTEPRDLNSIAERTTPDVADLVQKLDDHEFLVYDVASRQIVIVDEGWYDAVLNTSQQWTPAVGGRNGRSTLFLGA